MEMEQIFERLLASQRTEVATQGPKSGCRQLPEEEGQDREDSRITEKSDGCRQKDIPPSPWHGKKGISSEKFGLK
jgi:hypothetical protein